MENINFTKIGIYSEVSKQPDKITIPLKKHQLALLHKCSKLETSNEENKVLKSRVGIIGDTVGSGKTLSALSIIANQLEIQINQFPNILFSNNLLFCKGKTNTLEIINYPSNVIVVPHTIINQWEDTINKFTSLSYIKISKKKDIELFKPGLSHKNIVLISNNRYNEFCEKNKLVMFSRLFFDEADSIKIPRCESLNAHFYWFISSSFNSLINPYEFQYYINPLNGDISETFSPECCKRVYSGSVNHSGFIKNTMRDLQEIPKKITKKIVFRNDIEFVRQSFMLEDYRNHLIRCEAPFISNVLGDSISKNIMGFINAGDIDGAISQFECNKTTEKNLILTVTQDINMKIHNLKIKFNMKSQMEYPNPARKEEILKNINDKIDTLQKQQQMIKDKLDLYQQCSICYDTPQNTTITPCCNTKFCFACISKWSTINSKCPFCRTNINPKSLIVVVKESAEKPKPIEKKLDKVDHLREIIENRKKSDISPKILVFSEFSNSFDKVEQMLDTLDIGYSRVLGASSSVSKIISKYKCKSRDDRFDVLLLNAKQCASGINLENTTDIVFFHAMNSDLTQQIIGRGQRPGRKSVLDVWTIVYNNEI